MLHLESEILLYSREEGGLSRDGYSGMMASISVDDDLVMSKIIYKEIGTPIKRGENYNVKIELPYGEAYKDKIYKGYKFTINYASRIVGIGKVMYVL